MSIVTKSALVMRDVDLLTALARDRLVHVMVSLTSLDPSLKRVLEPRTASPSARLATIRGLADAGVPVGTLIAPVIPVITDAELETLLERAVEAGARRAGYVLLRLPLELKALFTEWLHAHHPGKASARPVAAVAAARGPAERQPLRSSHDRHRCLRRAAEAALFAGQAAARTQRAGRLRARDPPLHGAGAPLAATGPFAVILRRRGAGYRVSYSAATAREGSVVSVRESGDVICNRYELVERIGAGGHGEIWSAIDEHDGQKVALKFLRDDLASSVEAWAILNHESQMARRLNHPGILRSGTPMRDEEQTVMPMEYAGGGDLKRLRGQSYLRSVPVLIRIAEILAHAHARGVVHRDLKPGNVLFDEQGNVRLADFGAAGLSGSTHSHAQGSPFTASPQQLQDLPAAPGDDIYGLGALAYELLSGQPPYYPNATPDRVLREPVPDLVPAQPAPARLVALIMRMLAKDPAARPATMLQVVEGLNQALSDTLIVDDTEPSEVVPSLPDRDEPVGGRFEALRADRRPPAPPRLLPAAGWLGAAGVAGAVLVALLVLQPWRPGAAPRRETAPDTTRPPPVPPASEAAATPTAPPTVTPPPPAQAPPAAGPDPRPAGELSRHVEKGARGARPAAIHRCATCVRTCAGTAAGRRRGERRAGRRRGGTGRRWLRGAASRGTGARRSGAVARSARCVRTCPGPALAAALRVHCV